MFDKPAFYVTTEKTLGSNVLVDKWLLLGKTQEEAEQIIRAAFLDHDNPNLRIAELVYGMPLLSLGRFVAASQLKMRKYPQGDQTAFPLYFVRYSLANTFHDYLLVDNGCREDAAEAALKYGSVLLDHPARLVAVVQVRDQNSYGFRWLTSHQKMTYE